MQTDKLNGVLFHRPFLMDADGALRLPSGRSGDLYPPSTHPSHTPPPPTLSLSLFIFRLCVVSTGVGLNGGAFGLNGLGYNVLETDNGDLCAFLVGFLLVVRHY